MGKVEPSVSSGPEAKGQEMGASSSLVLGSLSSVPNKVHLEVGIEDTMKPIQETYVVEEEVEEERTASFWLCVAFSSSLLQQSQEEEEKGAEVQ